MAKSGLTPPDTNGESDLLHVVAFVVVETTLHGKYFLVAQTSEDEATRVPLHCRNREVRNIGVGEYFNDFDFFCQTSKTGA